MSGAFIGRLNNDRVRKALRGAIDSFLTTMVIDEALTGYQLEVTATRAFLSRFKTEAVTQAIVDRGADLYRHWHPSHGIDVNDALLAATVAGTGGKLYTQNLKHYPMPDIAVLQGW